MYARVTLLELDPVRFEIAAALERFQALVLPDLRSQPGYEGVYLLANEEGKGVVITLWESEEDAEAALASGFYTAQLERFVALFRAPPGRESYEVVFAEAPDFARSTR
jgi:heme-degrading monooxygenase HmoA